MNDVASKATPSNRVVRVPKIRVVVVAIGEMSKATEIDSPPMKANCILVAPGNVDVER
jgi:hypothetical protein